MTEPVSRVSEERLIAVLRLVAVPVFFIGQVYIAHPEPTPTTFDVALTVFTLYAVAALVYVRRRQIGPNEQVVFAVLDVTLVGALTFASGGGFSQLRFAFVFGPLTCAFRQRPGLTAFVSALSIAVYLVQAFSHPSRAVGDWESFVLVQTVYLAWICAAATLLSLVLARRQTTVERLLTARQQLVAEALAAEERERKKLSEDLHDDAIQNLLAARHELEDRALADPDGSEARAYEAVTQTLRSLREAVRALHPHLLERAGLEAALSNTAERASRRGGFVLDLDLDRETGGPNDGVLLRCASELLSNAATHAHAHHVQVRLFSENGHDVLEVQDDGVGFDALGLDARLADGHIGLLSLRERAEALGGSLEMFTAPGAGSRFRLELPRG